MLIPNSQGEVLIYQDNVYSVFVGPVDGGEPLRYRVVDRKGADITDSVTVHNIGKSRQRQWLEIELRRDGFVGPFCTVDPLYASCLDVSRELY